MDSMTSLRQPVFRSRRKYFKAEGYGPESFEEEVKRDVSAVLDSIRDYCKGVSVMYGEHGDPEWMYKNEVMISILFTPNYPPHQSIQEVRALLEEDWINYSSPLKI